MLQSWLAEALVHSRPNTPGAVSQHSPFGSPIIFVEPLGTGVCLVPAAVRPVGRDTAHPSGPEVSVRATRNEERRHVALGVNERARRVAILQGHQGQGHSRVFLCATVAVEPLAVVWVLPPDVKPYEHWPRPPTALDHRHQDISHSLLPAVGHRRHVRPRSSSTACWTWGCRRTTWRRWPTAGSRP